MPVPLTSACCGRPAVLSATVTGWTASCFAARNPGATSLSPFARLVTTLSGAQRFTMPVTLAEALAQLREAVEADFPGFAPASTG